MATKVKLPELGEGIEQAEVVRVLVSVGDSVVADQPLLEIETDKATVEVPAPVAGTVTSVAVAAGGTIAVGATIVILDTVAAEPDATATEPAAAVKTAASDTGTTPTVTPPPAEAPTPATVAARPSAPVSRKTAGKTGRRALAAPSIVSRR